MSVSTHYKYEITDIQERKMQDCVLNGMAVSGSYTDKSNAIYNRIKDIGYKPGLVLITEGWKGMSVHQSIIIKHVGKSTLFVLIKLE